MVHAANFRKNFIMLGETVYICLPTSSGPEDFTKQSSIPNWWWCNGIPLRHTYTHQKMPSKCYLDLQFTNSSFCRLELVYMYMCLEFLKTMLGSFFRKDTTVTPPWSLHSPTITNYPVFVSEGPRYPPWPYRRWDTSEVNYNIIIPISSPGT